MVVERASGTLMASSLKQDTSLILEVRPSSLKQNTLKAQMELKWNSNGAQSRLKWSPGEFKSSHLSHR